MGSELKESPSPSLDSYLSSIESASSPEDRLRRLAGIHRTLFYRIGAPPFEFSDTEYFDRIKNSDVPQDPFKMFVINPDLTREPIWQSFATPRQVTVLDKDKSPKVYVLNVPAIETVEATLTSNVIIGTTNLVSCGAAWTYKHLPGDGIVGMLTHIQVATRAGFDQFFRFSTAEGYPEENMHFLFPGYTEKDLENEKENSIRESAVRYRNDLQQWVKGKSVRSDHVMFYRQPWIAENRNLTPTVALTKEGFMLYSAEKQFKDGVELWKK